MRRVAVALAIAAVAACGGRTPAPSGPPPSASGGGDARAEVEAAYGAYAHACETHDLAGVMARLTDDVEWRLDDGTVQHRAEIEPSMKAFLATIPPGAKVWFTFDDVAPDADGTVKAEVVFHLKSDVKETSSQWHDTWVKGAAGWQNSVGIEIPKPKPPAPPR